MVSPISIYPQDVYAMVEYDYVCKHSHSWPYILCERQDLMNKDDA